MEVELKLALAPKHVRRLQAHPLLRAATATRKHLRNIYFDTPDLKLSGEGSALRLRQQGDVWLQTVKCAGVVSGGLAARPEWETPYSGQFDFSTVDDKNVRRQLEQLAPRLTPIFETNFERTTWCLEPRPGARLLVMLDRGWVAAQGRRDEICEVEIESAGATSDDLFALAESLAEHVALTPALRSKAERGYRLHGDVKEMPSHASPPELHEDMTPVAAFRTVALACLEQIIANQTGARRDEDPEYVHQMRVGTRRLRAALQLFRPCLPADFEAPFRATVTDLARCLGRVRDLDVLYIGLIHPVIESHGDDKGVAALGQQVIAARGQASAQLRKTLESREYGRWLLKASAELHRLKDQAGFADLKLGSFLQDRLSKRVRDLRRQAKEARSGSAEQLHRLRIAAKRLRYALDASPSAIAPHHIKALAHAQDVLGHLNDLAHGLSLLSPMAARDPTWRAAERRIAAFHQQRHLALLRASHKLTIELHDIQLPLPHKRQGKRGTELPSPKPNLKTMDIILWRHAEAEDLQPDQDDLDRKLTAKGKKQAKRMAAWLAKRLPADAHILVSPAQRTRQTADALDMPYSIIPEIAPSANHADLARAIGWPNGQGAAVIVGHQPTLGQFAAWLLTGNACDLSIAKGAVWWLRASRKNGVLQVAVESVTAAKR